MLLWEKSLNSLSSVSQIFCQIEFLHIFAFHDFFLSLHYCPFVATSKWTIYHFSNAWNDSKLQFYTNQLVQNWVLDNFGRPKMAKIWCFSQFLVHFWMFESVYILPPVCVLYCSALYHFVIISAKSQSEFDPCLKACVWIEQWTNQNSMRLEVSW